MMYGVTLRAPTRHNNKQFQEVNILKYLKQVFHNSFSTSAVSPGTGKLKPLDEFKQQNVKCLQLIRHKEPYEN